ncbi:MAG: protein-tyrosine phosphatase [Planctomycetota bacterium]|jgi:protein-tyrosine phosphatase
MTKVLFVCMGNICRSPSAEFVFAKIVADAGLAPDFQIESAGTHAYHIGNAADPRSGSAAVRRGYSLDGHRARRVAAADYEHFDYILAMDKSNLGIMQSEAPSQYQDKLALFLDFATKSEIDEVPDPYYGEGESGFELVLDLIEDASHGLLTEIKKTS